MINASSGLVAAGSSARLNQLLDNAGFPQGRGRAVEFASRFGTDHTTASSWLSDDMLPRDIGEMEAIAQQLNSTAAWWAFGAEENQPAPDIPTPKTADDFMLVGECVNEILCYLDDALGGGIDIAIDDEILMGSYGEVYADAKKNKGKFNRDLVARAAVKVSMELYRREKNR
ncbi:hypothetical protein ACJJIU_22265 (plasmid) [Microbulbifer sp. CnH-101-E]|uniref:hypothetical protein n=1 Tax=unclassified Microbulbifer TaxID=2619833 RepID=UPI00403A28FB